MINPCIKQKDGLIQKINLKEIIFELPAIDAVGKGLWKELRDYSSQVVVGEDVPEVEINPKTPKPHLYERSEFY